jgi:uncharacterized membrane-anchored protein
MPYVRVAAFLAALLVCATARAADPAVTAELERKLDAAWAAAAKVAKGAPATLRLNEQGSFTVPEGAAFVPLPEAAEVMRAMGNRAGDNFVGLIAGTAPDDHWLAAVAFIKEGYIRDDDAKEWNAEDLLQHLKDGTEAANQDRRARGFPALEIIGWIEKPAYDPGNHRLVWSISARSENAPPDAPRTVNYNTYLLGREGFFSLNFITGDRLIEAQKPIARGLLAGLAFDDGKRYQDFDTSTDKVAAYGLAALVGGAVLKKVGFFAVAVAFLAKFAKLGAVLAIGAVAVVARWFKRSRKTAA